MDNSDIEKAINLNLKLFSNSLESIENLHPLLTSAYLELKSYDFDNYTYQLKNEVREKVIQYWTNPELGVDDSQELDAYLFEYYYWIGQDIEAISYGIIDWQNYELSPFDLEMGWDYDFAEGQETGEGITLSFFNPLEKLESQEIEKQYESLEISDEKGYEELVYCYLCKGLLVMHKAFRELDAEGAFDRMNCKHGFLFLLGLHDAQVNPIWIKN